MKYHSDQVTDLKPDSNIVIFSCYEYEDENRTLQLKIKLIILHAHIICNYCDY